MTISRTFSRVGSRVFLAALVSSVTACGPEGADRSRQSNRNDGAFVEAERDLGVQACHELLAFTSIEVAISSAALVPSAGELPEHCLVTGVIQPNVGFEAKLPTDWNGKFFQAGNGGAAGSIQDDQTYGLRRGYATAATDTGHQGPDRSFGLSRPAEIDWGYRSIHVTQDVVKRLIRRYYGRDPAYSYFKGCSTGGRQGLLEAQRFPEDFDGIIAGAPNYDYSLKQTFNAAWVTQALFGENRAGLIPLEKLKTISDAVYGTCDAIDGLEDGIIDDPRRCDFDPMTDLEQCPAGTDSNECFTAPQLEAIRKIYDGPGEYYNREGYYPGHVVGGEWMPKEEAGGGPFVGGWDLFFIGLVDAPREDERERGLDAYGGDPLRPVQVRNSNAFFRYFAFSPDRPDFDVLTDLDFSDLPERFASEKIVDARDPELGDFRESGGKIIMWHGWADVGLNPIRTVQYYEKVQETMGETEANDFMRLFMLPGVYHCSGGRGPDLFDDLTALERWVEDGVSPASMVAYKMPPSDVRGYISERKGLLELDRAEMSRPLCRYPQVARYDGSGSPDDARNFTCVTLEN